MSVCAPYSESLVAILCLALIVGTVSADSGSGRRLTQKGKPIPNRQPSGSAGCTGADCPSACISLKPVAESCGYSKKATTTFNIASTCKPGGSISYVQFLESSSDGQTTCGPKVEELGSVPKQVELVCGKTYTYVLHDGNFGGNKQGLSFDATTAPSCAKSNDNGKCVYCGPYTIEAVCTEKPCGESTSACKTNTCNSDYECEETPKAIGESCGTKPQGSDMCSVDPTCDANGECTIFAPATTVCREVTCTGTSGTCPM